MDLSLLKALDKHEIPSVIEKGYLFGGTLILPTLTSTHTFPIKHISIHSEGKMVIQLFEPITLEDSWHISIKFNYRNFFFHLDPGQFSLQGETLVADFPREGRALTQRDNERYALPLNVKISSTLHRIEKRGTPGDITAYLIDVSARGLGIMIQDTQEEMLLKNDHIWVKSLNQVELITPIFGRIAYVSHRRFKDQRIDCRVGISLDEELPEALFIELQQLCHLILSA
jgi:hypothetical protein